MRRAVALAAAALALACASAPPAFAPRRDTTAVDESVALELRRRAEGFYLRLAHRRFNTLETYNDKIMRDYFQSLDLFYDYYADLAEDLLEANFEKSRPQEVEVLELQLDGPQAAQVLVRLRGLDGRPLRPGRTELARIDRWEWSNGSWWVRPGKL